MDVAGIATKRAFEHQNYGEVMWMLKKIIGSESILEIGSAHGHTLALMALACLKGSKVCSIDQGLYLENLKEVIESLNGEGYDAHLFHGDSGSKEAIAFAENHGPFDFIFIDGDHSYEGAKRDWENYGRLGKLVGFHDIHHPHHDVSKLWVELKATQRTDETLLSSMGIGLVYR